MRHTSNEFSFVRPETIIERKLNSTAGMHSESKAKLKRRSDLTSARSDAGATVELNEIKLKVKDHHIKLEEEKDIPFERVPEAVSLEDEGD